GGRQNLVLPPVWPSRPKKAVSPRRFKAQSRLGAITTYSTVQAELARTRLGVPPAKLHTCLHPVDERFWQPLDEPVQRSVLSVGAEARDFPTLGRALDGLD